MRAKILIPFRDGNRLFKAGEVIATNPRAALFLFSSKYAEPADDESREFCQKRGYAQSAHPTSTGT